MSIYNSKVLVATSYSPCYHLHMKIYVAHSTGYNFRADLYIPLGRAFSNEHELFLPHEAHPDGVESRDIIASSDVVLAEVSLASTGQGIELGWANASGVKIVCFYRTGSTPSGALRFISDTFIEYSDPDDMIARLRTALETITQ